MNDSAILKFGGQFASRIRSNSGSIILAIAMFLVAAFSVFLVFNEDPWALGRGIVIGIAYLVAIILSIFWSLGSSSRKSPALILLVSTIVVVGGVYAISGGKGYPETTAIENFPVALVLNLIAWVPVVGSVLFAMPVWRAGSPKSNQLSRLIGGSVIAAAILLNLIGIQASGSLLSTPVTHLPLNPYPAYGECDSGSADTGCVYVNQLYVSADYVFWFAVVILASVASSEFVSHRMGSRAPVRRAVLYSVAFVLVVIMGLVVIPASTAGSGVLVPSGNTFSFDPLNSYVRVPFNASNHETLSGAFESSAALDVYILNSSQFASYARGGGAWCPISSATPLSVNAAHGSIGASLGNGSYSLLFCGAGALQRNLPSIELTISSPIKLSI